MDVTYLHLSSEQELPTPLEGPFLMVLICEVKTSSQWRNRLCAWAVDSLCLYFCAWGLDCEDWHDRVDWEVLGRFDFGDIPDEKFIMTTWHAKDSLHEALWFACYCATHPHVEIGRTLLVHVAERADGARLLDAYDKAMKDDFADGRT